METRLRATISALFLIILLAMPMTGFADPPARVGRLAEYGGAVYLANGDTGGEWRAIGVNQPLTSGDSIYVAPGGRAEIEFGSGFLRLGDDTNVHLSTLDDQRISISVASGEVAIRIVHLEYPDAVVWTENAEVGLLSAGNYRVDVRPDLASTIASVREGRAELRLAGNRQAVDPGQSVTVAGYDNPLVSVNGVRDDAFDAWVQARDLRYASGASSYVSQDMPGWRDLEDYGYWQPSPEYGAVWYPNVPTDWAPYSDGEWSWVSPWGWTWVDHARWGFATAHYGRWVRIGARWGWCPGPHPAPVYAPALVAFYGSQGGHGPVYWVPLGWNEPYYPLYGASPGYWRRVNQPYVRNLAEMPAKPPASYGNWNVPGAVNAVQGALFTGARPVRQPASPPAAINLQAITSPTALVMKPTSSGMIVKPVGQAPPAMPGLATHSPGTLPAPAKPVRELALPSPAVLPSPGRVVAPRTNPVTSVPPASSPSMGQGLAVREKPSAAPLPGGYMRPPHAPESVAPVLGAPSIRQAPPQLFNPAASLQGSAPVVRPGVPGPVHAGSASPPPNANSGGLGPLQPDGSSIGIAPPTAVAPADVPRPMPGPVMSDPGGKLRVK
jgi:hypothetical protein